MPKFSINAVNENLLIHKASPILMQQSPFSMVERDINMVRVDGRKLRLSSVLIVKFQDFV
jgi:hypothetical protein